MTDYTRVIEGLKRHAGGGCFDDDSDSGCPYWDDKECGRHLAEDALELLELLKAQAQEDALELLKAQAQAVRNNVERCPHCGRRIGPE